VELALFPLVQDLLVAGLDLLESGHRPVCALCDAGELEARHAGRGVRV